MTGRLITCCDPSGIGRSRMYRVPGGVASLNHRLIAAIPPGSNDVDLTQLCFAWLAHKRLGLHQ